jgi:nitrogen fixation NifU-like protein
MTDLDTLYQDVVLDHKRRPRHYGPLPCANREAQGHNPLCGDTVTLRLREEAGRIEDVAFEGEGCAICVASASMLTEAVRGCTLSQAQCKMHAAQRMLSGDGEADEASLGKLVVLSGVRRFPSRIKCAALAWHALGHCLAEKGDAHAQRTS